MAPPRLTPGLRSLPPMLHRRTIGSMSTYSKASQGLFALPWFDGIFTVSAISPGLTSRQHPHRYTIRAGRNFTSRERQPRRFSLTGSLSLQGVAPASGPTFGTQRFATDRLERDECFMSARFRTPLCRHRDRTISSPRHSLGVSRTKPGRGVWSLRILLFPPIFYQFFHSSFCFIAICF